MHESSSAYVGSQRLVGRFFAWWLGNLGTFVPTPLRKLAFEPEGALDVYFAPGRVRLVRRRGADRIDLGEVVLDGAGADSLKDRVAGLLRSWPGSEQGVTLHLPPDQALLPRIRLPIEAAGNVEGVIAAEMHRYTPFAARDVFYDFCVVGTDPEVERLTVDLLVAKRQDVETILFDAAQMGIRPTRLTHAGDEGTQTCAFNLLPEADRIAPSRTAARTLQLAALLTLVLGLGWAWLWYDHNQRLLERSDAMVADLRTRISAVRASEDRGVRLIAAVNETAERKRRTPQVVELLNEVSRILPDHSWLIGFSLGAGQVTLDGYSSDPSTVLREIDGSPLFEKAEFVAPVRMEAGVNKEKFRVRASIVDFGGSG